MDAARLADPGLPLISVAVGVLLRGERGWVVWAARVAAYGFATFYTALDVLAGIGAGLVTDALQGGSPAVPHLFQIGDRLGAAGVYCLFACAVLTGIVLIRRDGSRAVPGTLVLAAACYPFLQAHIFRPEGVLAMLAIAAWCALLAAARPAIAPPHAGSLAPG